MRDLAGPHLADVDLLICLGPVPDASLHDYFNGLCVVNPYDDMRAPPKNYVKGLTRAVTWLEQDRTLMVTCFGGHGRTGTFLAGLVALLEPDTADPIAAVRERYCQKAVEVQGQINAIFALAGRPVPEAYQMKTPVFTTWNNVPIEEDEWENTEFCAACKSRSECYADGAVTVPPDCPALAFDYEQGATPCP